MTTATARRALFFASLTRLMRIRHWRWAVLAQFCYVGAQNRLLELPDSLRYRRDPGHDGRFRRQLPDRHHGLLLYRPFYRHLAYPPLRAATTCLAIYAFIAMLLCLLSAFSGGHVGLLALTLCSAFMSIQYPTIFSLGIKHLGQDTKYGSSFIVMTIIGGGIVTPGDGLCQRTPPAISRPPNWSRRCASPSSLFLPVSVHKRRRTKPVIRIT